MTRLIRNTTEPVRCDWPEDIFIQGGARGVVLGGKDGPYRTAFVEAFPGTFLRGEGPSIADAERACWAKYEALRACPAFPDHGPWDRRDYRNGSAFCQGCGGWFSNQVTGLDELPEEEGRKPPLVERLFRGDDDALEEVLTAMAGADDLPERHRD
jgi:hypothetical protein